jgi:hypothetical protein
MTLEELEKSLSGPLPPPNLPPVLAALWWAGKENWKRAHELAQSQDNHAGAWVHAYLHRKEGDTSNAKYWYRQAQKSFPACSTEAEWKEICKELLGQLPQEA